MVDFLIDIGRRGPKIPRPRSRRQDQSEANPPTASRLASQGRNGVVFGGASSLGLQLSCCQLSNNLFMSLDKSFFATVSPRSFS